jgi:hypothetical protein
MTIVYLRPKSIRLTLADLDEPEVLLLWAVRTWVWGFQRGIPVVDDIVTGIAKLGSSSVPGGVDLLMTLVSRAAQRAVDIRCPRCTAVSPDEFMLLSMISSAQAGLRELAVALAGDALVPVAAPHAVTGAERLGEDLRAAGHVLPARMLPARAGTPAARPAEEPCAHVLNAAGPALGGPR